MKTKKLKEKNKSVGAGPVSAQDHGSNTQNNVGVAWYATQKAITLISLVITIIILIILAGVTINLSLGENGIFRTAKYAKEEYINATNSEKKDIAKLENEIASWTRSENSNSEWVTLSEEEKTNGEIILKDEIDKYSFIGIEASESTGEYLYDIRWFPVKEINKRTTTNNKIQIYISNSSYIDLYKSDKDKLTISRITGNMKIVRIYGKK